MYPWYRDNISNIGNIGNIGGISPFQTSYSPKPRQLTSQRSKSVPSKPTHLAIVNQSHSFNEPSFDIYTTTLPLSYHTTIKYKFFLKFWVWFKECCNIIKELSYLWDANEQSILQCNLFCGREECQEILSQAPQGQNILIILSVLYIYTK